MRGRACVRTCILQRRDALGFSPDDFFSIDVTMPGLSRVVFRHEIVISGFCSSIGARRFRRCKTGRVILFPCSEKENQIDGNLILAISFCDACLAGVRARSNSILR